MSSRSTDDSGFTPLMRQYHAVKAEHPDKILFFRMGDFYEMFGEDAVKAAPILGIALTSRAHGSNSERIPLAGVPYHAADRYLARLLEAGEKVVVVEQVEDPRTAHGLVKREVVEILTPGTATVAAADTPLRTPSLAALYASGRKQAGLALLDISTGSFLIDQGTHEQILERLRVAEPSEIIYPAQTGAEKLPLFLGAERAPVSELKAWTPYEDWNFDLPTAERELNQHFGTSTLEGFGAQDCREAVTAAGAIFRYLRENHRDHLNHVHRLTRLDSGEIMALDYSTVRNLELVRSISGVGDQHTLLAVMDCCQTAAGSRRLKTALLRPFTRREPIERRLSGVAELVRRRDLAASVREVLRGLPDLETLCGRLGIAKLSPRQAAAIGQALETAADVKTVLQGATSELVSVLASTLPDTREIIRTLETALTEEPPLVANKGNIIKRGYSQKLDDLNDSIRSARDYIGSLQEIERKRTGIPSLKVGFNKVFGYYLEITHTHTGAVPVDYIRKQTLVNAERYITPELKEKEELILAAEEKIIALESELFAELVAFLDRNIADLLLTADLLAELDLVSSLAELAVDRGYCKPILLDEARLHIENGRHPVVESVLSHGAFVANDVTLDIEAERIIILTGPNMSGKSTYLRQIGLIAIMAQIGSYVPADKAEIGLVDRVFTRVGAMDNLAGGQSTFLVEMVETANILNNATSKSLVLLDEVGRGTSTFDGMSVAWSVVERINDACGCRTVFATHYHELTSMAEIYDRIRNYQVAVKRWENRVIFLHKIIAGGCDDSYGIEVARLAGLPRPTINRARQILRLLESGKFTQSELGKGVYKERVQTSLFEPHPSKTEETIRALDLDGISPLEAFELLRRLKEELQ